MIDPRCQPGRRRPDASTAAPSRSRTPPARAARAAPRTAAARARRTGASQPGERVVLADIEGPGIDPPHLDDVPARPGPSACARCTSRCSTTMRPSRASRCRASTSSGCRTAARSRTHSGADGRAGRARLQQLPPDAVRPAACASSSSTARPRRTILYYQIDYTLQPELPAELGCLHVDVPPREPDGACGSDFVIADGLRGPGRFLGCNVGVRVIDPGDWYGEGEVKVYRDGDTDAPDDLRHRARGLRRQRVGHGRAQRALRRRAARASGRTDPSRTPTSSASTAGTCPTRSCSSATCG